MIRWVDRGSRENDNNIWRRVRQTCSSNKRSPLRSQIIYLDWDYIPKPLHLAGVEAAYEGSDSMKPVKQHLDVPCLNIRFFDN